MSGAAPDRHLKWWLDSIHTAERVSPVLVGHAARALALASSREALVATLAVQAWRWARRGIGRLTKQHEPRDAQALLAYARTLEKSMPNLAAELRCLACRA